jgi:hypothetical protein
MTGGCASVAKVVESMERGDIVGSRSVGDEDEMLHKTVASRTKGRSSPRLGLLV